jgi:hypothetical protein
MSAKRISRKDAEQLLRGVQAGPAEGLAGLLADAAAPGRPAELSGEETVMTAFRAAPIPTVSGRRLASFRHTFAKVVSVKVAGVLLAGTAVGGVAVAASNGSLPIQDGKPMWSSSTTATEAPEPKLIHKTAVPRPHPAPVPTPTPKPTTPRPSDLCRAYLKKALDEHKKDLKDLIAAAGGRKKILKFCSQFNQPDDKKPRRNFWPKDMPTTWPSLIERLFPSARPTRR